MNKTLQTILACSLCVALGVGSVCAFAATGEQNVNSETTEAQEEAEAVTEEGAGETEAEASEAESVTSKDETVYVLSGADGTVKKIIVSDWIKNGDESSTLTDASDLTDIENVKGEETYTVNSEGMKVWDAEGSDIYYQGNSEKELPVGLNVSYKLDGASISADDIAGKSGKVTIRFSYENRQSETVEINGKDETVYVPFAMLTGMILDNDNFRNVEVTNGKLINDGDRTIVIGLAFTGLQEDLNLNSDQIDLPEYVEITADATDFTLGTTVTVATNELFGSLDTDEFDSIDDLTSSLTELTDAMQQLMDGSSALYDGLCTLLDKSDELVSGVNKLADGAKSLQSGAGSLDAGAAELQSGIGELTDGLNKLSANSSTLDAGAAQVFSALLSTATTQVRAAGLEIPDLTMDNYAKVLSGVSSSLDGTAVYNQAHDKVTAAVEANRDTITAAVTQAVLEQVTSQVTGAVRTQVTSSVTAAVRQNVETSVLYSFNMTKSEYDAGITAGTVPEETQNAVNAAIEEKMASSDVQSQITAEVDKQMAEESIQSTISQNVETQMASDEVKSTISQNVQTQMKKAVDDNMNSEAVQSQISAAASGAQTIASLKASLDSYRTFYEGLCTYTSGVDSAASGANKLSSGAATLKSGTAELKSGADTLYNGILTLKNGMPALVDGVTELRDGAMKLSDGMKQFNEEGVEKIVNLVEDDLDIMIERLKATVEVSENYNNYAGIAEDMSGQVRFIYRTDEIKEK